MALQAETDFGLSLLKQNSLNHSTVFSPISIALALALVHAGSKGETRKEIRSALLKDQDDDEFVAHFRDLSNSMYESKAVKDEVKINLANRFFIDSSFTPLPTFFETISANFKASAESVNFADGTVAAKVINDFVNYTTKAKIQEIVGEDSFKDAVSFIVNALYFEAKWKHPFHSTESQELEFSTSKDHTNKIEFLTDFNVDRLYYEDDEVQVLSLPYTDPSYVYTIVLPKTRFGLSDIIPQLSAQSLQKYLSSTSKLKLTIQIPKMKIEKETELNTVLPKIGIRQMFSSSADLSGIIGSNNLRVTDIKHKAIIEVDEWGTIAAATTSLKIVPKTANLEDAASFIADHPFFYTITYNNHPLFTGTFFG